MAISKSISPLQALEDEIVDALVAETGLKPVMARYMVRPILQHLCSEYGGTQLYIPAMRKGYRVEDIRNDFFESRDVDAVCRKYSISRRTLYRLLDAEKVG